MEVWPNINNTQVCLCIIPLCLWCCRFGPLDLLGDAGDRVPLLLEPQQHTLSWNSSSTDILQQRAADAVFVKAAEAALAAAHKVRLELPVSLRCGLQLQLLKCTSNTAAHSTSSKSHHS